MSKKAKPQSYYDEAYFDADPTKGYRGPYTTGAAPFHRLAYALVRAFGPTVGFETVTDLGCARGFVIWWMKRQWPSLDVQGYDFSEYAVATAADVPVQVGDIVKGGPFRPADLVLCLDVLEHIAEKDLPKAMRTIREATQKVAVLQIYHPGADPWTREEAEDHVTLHDKDWWWEKLAENGLKKHQLHEYYVTELRKRARGPTGKMWARMTHVVEPDPEYGKEDEPSDCDGAIWVTNYEEEGMLVFDEEHTPQPA